MPSLLLVDDDVDQNHLRSLLFEREGHQVLTASTVDQAVESYRTHAPAAVIMDLKLPRTEHGLDLIRRLRALSATVRIFVLTGWPEELDGQPEAEFVERVIAKPGNSRRLLKLFAHLLGWCLLVLGFFRPWPNWAGQRATLRLKDPAQVVAQISMSSSGEGWGALAEVWVDGTTRQNVVVPAGAERREYAVFLGGLKAGDHSVEVRREDRLSDVASDLQVHGVGFRELRSGDPGADVLAHAPILHARRNTISGGRVSDVPLLVYAEKLVEGGKPLIQYSVVFSNEDGGTSTRALMARWGRTTDIEYVYRVWSASDGSPVRATIQGRDHQEIAYTGPREGWHPLLTPVTENNMVAPGSGSPVRFQLAPRLVDLTKSSREQVMDDEPFTYRAASAELARESKLRPFGTVDGQKISDPRNYLYIEADVRNRGSRIAAVVRLKEENRWRSSHLGRLAYGIERDGWVRTSVELPPGTEAGRIGEIGFTCLAAEDAVSGECTLVQVNKAFLLDRGHRPGRSVWSAPPETRVIPTGETIAFRLP